MSDNTNLKTFLLISNEKLAISVYDIFKKKNVFSKEILIKNTKSSSQFSLIQNFLDDHIYEIEKMINNFINNIHLVIENEDFFSVKISLKKNNYGNTINYEAINHLVYEAKNQCKKTINDRKIIHILIDNYLIDEKNFFYLPNKMKCDFFSIDINIICLSNRFIKNLEDILKKYQISIIKILSYHYLNNLKELNDTNSIFKIAEEILNGSNKNEVLITGKSSKNRGFFEKFFFLFN